MATDPIQLDITEILKLLPHRYPFLMVDRITEMIPGERCAGLKNVTMNEPFFQGHFPGKPVYPGVMILEGLAQMGAILAYYEMRENIGGKLVYFTGMDGVRFRRMVVPGDQILYEVKLVRKKMGIWTVEGLASVGGKVATEGIFMATFGA